MGNYTELFYHFVWATKRRQPFITPEVEPPLYDLFAISARRWRDCPCRQWDAGPCASGLYVARFARAF